MRGNAYCFMRIGNVVYKDFLNTPSNDIVDFPLKNKNWFKNEKSVTTSLSQSKPAGINFDYNIIYRNIRTSFNRHMSLNILFHSF